ncbi:RNA polymerase sigma factor [Streptomyces sp. BI20]|uniref:RNA polymerase sigma factor n=1 Tax=Streptomyces sp. BI20 TaxID=3403460 RepID=UPI003C7809A9
MTDREADPAGRQLSAELAGAQPVEFVAFHSHHHRAYLRYAHLQLGSREEAEPVVEDVFTVLLAMWAQALREPNLQAFAWAELRAAVEARRRTLGRPSAMVETAWFEALRRTSPEGVAWAEWAEHRLGLYSAIAELPERQYDVVLLVFLEGYRVEEAARTMGISHATALSQIRSAHRTLSRRLGVHWGPGEEVDR